MGVDPHYPLFLELLTGLYLGTSILTSLLNILDVKVNSVDLTSLTLINGPESNVESVDLDSTRFEFNVTCNSSLCIGL